jgi:hypothetical protein
MIIFSVSDLGMLRRMAKYYLDRYEDVLNGNDKKQLKGIIEKIEIELSDKGYLVGPYDNLDDLIEKCRKEDDEE